MDTINAHSSAINATVLIAFGLLFDMMSPPILELSWAECSVIFRLGFVWFPGLKRHFSARPDSLLSSKLRTRRRAGGHS
jgi:hypothetical protein